jgi:hypothetical protein
MRTAAGVVVQMRSARMPEAGSAHLSHGLPPMSTLSLPQLISAHCTCPDAACVTHLLPSFCSQGQLLSTCISCGGVIPFFSMHGSNGTVWIPSCNAWQHASAQLQHLLSVSQGRSTGRCACAKSAVQA